MNDLHAMTEGDVDTVARNIERIKAIADEMAGEGVSQAFDIYKLARDTLEILAFDRISRDALTKLGAGDEQFQGHKVTKQVLEFIKNSQKINAIKEFHYGNRSWSQGSQGLGGGLHDPSQPPNVVATI